ncbi:hypothetical protein D0867_06792 [Hortaea werneckii]|uniref:ATP synthase F(0) complex subunit e, mitochondrial n=2 Tax=Hortaea werneckii TaxID=91943 RepID=A0A3M6ZK71_HORWE|nr:hypothetical protein D0867_06792 [Hortaea werneckii]
MGTGQGDARALLSEADAAVTLTLIPQSSRANFPIAKTEDPGQQQSRRQPEQDRTVQQYNLPVLRWGALAFGVFYGFSHQSAINSRDRSAHAQHEYERKEKLIQQARDEWQRKTQPQSGSGVISNPEDPNFDLEKYLQTVKA